MESVLYFFCFPTLKNTLRENYSGIILGRENKVGRQERFLLRLLITPL